MALRSCQEKDLKLVPGPDPMKKFKRKILLDARILPITLPKKIT